MEIQNENASVGHLHLGMERDETTKISSATEPIHCRDDYFTAIPRRRNVNTKTIPLTDKVLQIFPTFRCGKKAEKHRKQISAEDGCIVQHDTFKQGGAITHIGGKENEERVKRRHLSPSAERQDNCYEQALHQNTPKLYVTDVTMIEQLPQDVLSSIYGFLCPGNSSIYLANRIISIIGLASKRIYQSCIEFIKLESFGFDTSYTKDFSCKAMVPFLRNRAKIGRLNMGIFIKKSPRWFLCQILIILKHLDLSKLSSLILDTRTFGPMTAGEKWDLVENGFMSINSVKIHDRESSEDFYTEIADFITSSGIPYLRDIELIVRQNTFMIYDGLLRHATDQLEVLDITLCHELSHREQQIVIKKIESLVAGAPRLKTLRFEPFGQNKSLRIRSRSLESVKLTDEYCAGLLLHSSKIDCPSLSILEMKVVLDSFDPDIFARSSSFRSIKSMRLIVDSTKEESFRKYRLKAQKLFVTLGQMPLLRNLDIQVVCHIPPIEIDLRQIEHLNIEGAEKVFGRL